MNRSRLLALAFVAVAVGCNNVSSATSSQSSHQIEIASEFPLSGPLAFPDLGAVVDVAFAQHPTVGGYRLVHVTLDDSLGGVWNLDRALQNMRRAVREPAILGVVGPLISFQAQVLIPMASPANLAVISPSNSLDCLTDPVAPCLDGPRAQNSPTNYFRLAARDTDAAKASADFAIRKLAISRVAVLTNPIDIPYAQPMADAFSGEFAAMGGKVVFRQNFYPLVPAAPSYAPMLRDARAAGAQAVYMSSGFDPACAMRKDLNEVFGPDAYLIVGDRVGDSGCIEQAGLTGQTDDHFVLTLNVGQPRAIPPALRGFEKGRSLHIYVLAAYDCAEVLIDALGRAIRTNGGKLPTREQVRAAVAETANFTGVTGSYSFGANGDVVTPGFSFYTVQKGNWAFWQSS